MPVALERASGETLTDQLVASLRDAVHRGLLPTDTRLPSTRTLADELSVSRTVVAAAYARLVDEGYLEGRHGSGTYVRTLNEAARHGSAAPQPSEPVPSPTTADIARFTFRTGVTAPDAAPEGWGRALREVARTTPPNRYLDAQGEPPLRAAIAAYLARSRGLTAEPESIVVTSGATQSLDLIMRTLVSSGDKVACEEPGHPGVRALLACHGLTAVALPVDNDGARPQDLPRGRGRPRLAHVTPSHQFPLGVRMTIGRRLDLVAWAREEDAFIIEDDYDSEYRFDGPPLPTLTGLDPERVLYLGTLSKTLTPAIRCGYLVAPRDMARRITRLKDLCDGPLSWPVQQTLLHLIESGRLERHVRRTRQRYAAARAALRGALAPVQDAVTLTGIEAGLHVVLCPRAGLSAERIAERARANGVSVTTLADFYTGPDKPDGLLLGYAGMSEVELVEAAEVLVRTISDLDED
ncbi:PLP-dependent aminotransferase family protein [Streptomyces sp. DT2A-34]|uniref:MocR-like pyridoxine biosynthesis transcription factor PdxR n=1 Tax=Streptomyces sp. DT2A-34 TaxID=3051182 RepID=UPI00265B7AE1|nr:PLP-dependent aminotransferase family protein [Streptomyces sp. DT2A-34]MDO0916617.1 PLP-dependent aminotransferase family protein [Streptomyces sp. DT2A-34]